MLFDLVKKYKNYATTVTRTTENYQPNLQVMSLIKTNSVILEDAKAKYSKEALTPYLQIKKVAELVKSTAIVK